jgi:hypothetical protein
MRSFLNIAPIDRERVLGLVPDAKLCEECLSLLDKDPLHTALVLPDEHVSKDHDINQSVHTYICFEEARL